VLKRGIVTKVLWDWFYDCIQGKVVRSGLSVILNGYAGIDPMRWDLIEAVPVKWVGPNFKSGANEAAVETLELAHHGFIRK
jgi:phage tail-like protein